ncbi:Checkpoint protein hus1 [Savitreella phatthalungensis]
MRFRANVAEAVLLGGLFYAVSQVNKLCRLQLCREMVRIMSRNARMQVWASLPCELVFTDINIESNADDNIILELNADLLSKLLRQISSSFHISVKLSKRSGAPMLSFTTMTELQGPESKTTITHDLPVRVIAKDYASQWTEPQLATPDVMIMAPSALYVAQVATGLRNISDKLYIEAGPHGDLLIGIATPSVEVTTKFSNLMNPAMVSDRDEEFDVSSSNVSNVRLSIGSREFCAAMRVAQLSHRLILCFLRDSSLLLYFNVHEHDEEAMVTYYLTSFEV